MDNLPTGTVTFLYTDIEGSTTRWESHPELMKPAVERHDAILRRVIQANGGVVFRTMGDAFCAAFRTATMALSAAVEAQRAVAAEEWDEHLTPFRVRMALHTGTGEVRDGDYVGAHLNRIARLIAAGYGGQVLATQATADLVRDALPEGTNLRDLGEHQLKDLQRPEHIFEASIRGLPGEFPPIKTLDRRPHNLPMQRTPIIGREREVAAAGEMLLKDEIGVLTLTGPGGTGKTRLGLQICAELVERFEDGVYFVALAPVDDPTLVVPTIARTLEVPDVGGRTQMDGLKDYLRPKHMLLYLDNFEQVVRAAPAVAELLAAAPRLKVLVTSREALHIYGEYEFPVSPLSVPDIRSEATAAPMTAQRLTQYEAVRLFIERAKAIKPDFSVNDDNAPAVAEICYRLDGLPLAIELAAARIRLLTPQAMLSRLNGKLQSRSLNAKQNPTLQLLTGGARDLPARQQTLRGAIEWSYDILSSAEQMLFNRLSIFRGGCTLEAAEAICGGQEQSDGGGQGSGLSNLRPPTPDPRPLTPLETDLLDGLESLVSKSLVRQSESGMGEPRFWMLETIREYGLERLDVTGELEPMRRRHAAYYVAFAEEGEKGIEGSKIVEWLDLLEAEHNNIQAVLEWTIEQAGDEGGVEQERSDGRERSEWALRLTGALWHFWHARGYLSEGIRWADKAMEAAGEPWESLIWVRALMAAGFLRWTLGRPGESIAFMEQAYAISKKIDHSQYIAFVASMLAGSILSSGQYKDDEEYGLTCLEEGLALSRQLPGLWTAAFSIMVAGLARNGLGDFEEAKALCEEALGLYRKMGDLWGISQAVNILGDVARIYGNYEEAKRLYEETLSLHLKLGVKPDLPASLHNVAYVELHLGNSERANALFKESLLLQRERANKYGVVECLFGLASEALAREAEPLALGPQRDNLERAARLFAAATRLRSEMQEMEWPAEMAEREQSRAKLRTLLSEAEWREAEEAGRRMSLEEAIEYALRES